MYPIYFGIAALLVVAWLLVLFKPLASVEGFATAAVHPTLMPECVARSTDAQALLARIPENAGDDAAELRLLVSKLCCLEADIASPGVAMRTQSIQFRTSQDMEPASAFVGRCLRGAVTQRDIDLSVEKMEGRGHELLRTVFGDSCADATREFDAVIARTRLAMVNFCLRPQPTMDHPIGARDMGFWEPDSVADLSQYQGISAVPK